MVKTKKDIYLRVNPNDKLKSLGSEFMMITEFAKLCGCNVHTIRHYDEVEILLPAIIDEESGYRYYQKEQIEQYKFIKKLQEVGFSIKEIKTIIVLSDEEKIELFNKKINEIESMLTKAKMMKQELEKQENEKDN